jgi:hypothetical protein
MTKRLLSVILSIAAAVAASPVGWAQSQTLPVCTVSTDIIPPNCPSSSGWASGLPGFTCAHRTVTCTSGVEANGTVVNIASNGITIGYAAPSRPNGTIVLLSSRGGTEPQLDPGQELTFAQYYFSQNYQIVQTAWDNDWEDTGTGNVKNIAYAAARAAAFLNWVRYGSSTGGAGLYGSGGMCVHGTSGGGGATAYVLAWYGGGSYIDKVAFLSSPPMGDIEQGCEVIPVSSAIHVCPSGQLGCNSTNAVSNWAVEPYYTDALSNMRTWSDDTTLGASGVCRNPTIYNTSSTANAEWKAMSISDGSIGTFSYPNTNMTAWLCANVYSTDGLNDGVMNNSSPQSQLFFQNFTSSSQSEGLLINAITSCDGTEGVAGTDAVPPGNYVTLGYTTGMPAIEYDMTADPANLCKAHH